jgi:hypothetical protein
MPRLHRFAMPYRQTNITAMRTPGIILIPVALALFSSAAPASARYTEHWVSSAEVVRNPQKSVAPQKIKHTARKAPVQTAVNTPDDDPIAAFARKPARR